MTARLPAALRTLFELADDDRRLGPCKLVRPLGHGGFAPVWLAKEIYRGTEVREVAVKLFARPAVAAPHDGSMSERSHKEAVDRDPVIEEARALCQVEHPNVVRFYQLLLDDERGIVGLVMEYVSGAALDRRLEDGKLSTPEALVVGIAVASALSAVHAAGLVHRDVKPANVIESGGVYKLIDFGIAAAETPKKGPRVAKQVVLDDLPLEVLGTKMSMVVDPEADTVSSTGSAILSSGTVGYMDPVCVATGVAATPASDLYSLGALLFECLTGKLPAVAAMPDGGGMRGEILDGRGAPPSVLDVEPSVPLALGRVVDALLSPGRKERPASAAAVLEELRAIAGAPTKAGDAPTSAAAPSTQPSALPPSWAQRNRRLVGLLGLATAVSTAGGLALWDRARLKVSYCATTLQRRGVYECFSPVSGPEGRNLTHRFSTRGGRVIEVATVNGHGIPRPDGGPTASVRARFVYDEQGRVSRWVSEDRSGQIDYQYAFSWHSPESMQALRLDRNDLPTPEPETDTAMHRDELDANGRARRVLFTSDRGSPRAVRGAFGYEIVRDALGLETEYIFLGPGGAPAARNDGVERARFLHDAAGHTTESSFFGAGGSRVLQSRGYSITRTRFDARGNASEVAFFGVDERPVLTKSGFATMRSKYDADGNEIEKAYFDTDDHPILCSSGFATSRSKYDGRGNEIERAHFGVTAEPVTMQLGFSAWHTKYDERGRDVERSYYGTSGEPVLNGAGYAVLRTVYDERGNGIERASFGTDGRPIVLKAGRAVSRFRYDERGNQIEAGYFGADGGRMVAKDGCASWRYGFDDRGHVISRSCFGLDDKPLAAADGCVTTQSKYDELGRPFERSCVDAAGQPAPFKEGYATVRSRFDDRNNEIEKSYLDVAGRPKPTSLGYAIWRGKHDERGRVIEESYFDADGKPTKRRDGYASRRLVRDDRGNEIERAYFDEAGAPASGSDGAAVVRVIFDAFDDEIVHTFFGPNGESVLDHHGCAIWRASFDAHRNEIERVCIGKDGNVATTKEGFARWRASYDERGTLRERSYFDAENRPVPKPPPPPKPE